MNLINFSNTLYGRKNKLVLPYIRSIIVKKFFKEKIVEGMVLKCETMSCIVISILLFQKYKCW